MGQAVAYLQLLRRHGFGGSRLFGSHGNLVLHYRRAWHGLADVVLVFGEDDAEGYRGDDCLDHIDPFGLASRPDLVCEVSGTVAEVVTAVLGWPAPERWSGYPPQ